MTGAFILVVKTIRYYEEIGLIPKAGRTNGGARTGGHRLYTGVDVGRLRFVGLRAAIGALMSPARQAGGDKCCSWESCGCMHKE